MNSQNIRVNNTVSIVEKVLIIRQKMQRNYDNLGWLCKNNGVQTRKQ